MNDERQSHGPEARTPAATHALPRLGKRVAQALASLREIEGELRAGGEPGHICQLVARGLGELVLADVVVVSGASSGQERGLPLASYTSPDQPIKPRLVDVTAASARLQVVPIVRLDAAAEPDDLAADEQQYLRGLGAAQALIMPLVRQHHRLGRVDVLHTRPVALGPVELDLCQQFAGQAATTLGLARGAAAEAEAGSAELMLRISEALRQAQPGGPAELLQVVVALLPGMLGCDRSYAYVWHADRHEFVPVAVKGMTEEQIAILRQYPMNPQVVPLFEQMVYSTRPVSLDAVGHSTMLPAALVEQLGLQALLALPIRGRRRQVLGALILDYTTPERRFNLTQVGLAGHVVEHVAAMVENASLYEEVSRRSDRLAVLNEIGLDLATLTDLPTIFPELHAKLASVIDASALLCALTENEGGALTLYHMAGPRLSVRERVEPASSTLLFQVFEERQGLVLNAGAAPLVNELASAELTPLPAESIVCVPMRVRGQKVIGALAAYSAFGHAYTQDDLELLSTVASQIAVGVDNARLYAEVDAKGRLRGQLLDRIMSEHELERKSIVDDIHDDTLQAMVSSMYKIDLCLRLSGTQNHQRELEELRNVRISLSSNIDRLRTLIFEIRPSTLDYLGLLPTLDHYLGQLEKETGIRATFRSELGSRLQSGMETLIYRLLQELLSNVRKHSRAQTVTILLKRVREGVEVVVEDDGIGFIPEAVLGADLSREGIGLAAVRERAQVAGGVFELHSQPSKGTRVRIVLPLTAGRHITAPLEEGRLPRDTEGL